MKYYIVNVTVRDGEYEYLSQHPMKGHDEKTVLDAAMAEAEEWTATDWRENEVRISKEITKQEYEVIARHIY